MLNGNSCAVWSAILTFQMSDRRKFLMRKCQLSADEAPKQREKGTFSNLAGLV